MDPFMAQIQTNYLKDKLVFLENAEEPDQALIDSLKEILRNQVPTAWKQYEDLYRTAVACVGQINLFHPDLMGRRSDRGSLLVAVSEFAQQAEVIVKSGGKDAGKLEDFITKIAEMIGFTANYYETEYSTLDDEMMKVDPKQTYINSLRSLCIDFPEDFEHHTYKNQKPSSGNIDTSRLYRELAAYKTQLPVEYASSIFVRASSNRLHLVKACIIGPETTPYQNGVFFFDIFLNNYPQEPPKVNFLTTGGGRFRQNPNLYQNGKVCLSLLGTWQGEPWQPNKSTLLQVLVSIQSLIFVNDPYFNEPGFEKERKIQRGIDASKAYNLNLYHQVTEAAILEPLQKKTKVPPEFKDVVNTHFYYKKKEIEAQLEEWAKEDTNSSHKMDKLVQQVRIHLGELKSLDDCQS